MGQNYEKVNLSKSFGCRAGDAEVIDNAQHICNKGTASILA